jgi:hypothetical protein
VRPVCQVTTRAEMRVYAITIFIGAFLLFQVEPMLTKYILPWFGGTTAVWTTCLLFFQSFLLAGYTYSHLIGTRLSPREQTITHLALLTICVLVMGLVAVLWRSPIMPDANWKPASSEFPVWRILLLLSASIGLPFFVLSTTAPLLQAWFARTFEGISPYRLYALSNFGSLLALFSYPVVVEPALSLHAQAYVWSGLYMMFALGMVLCAIRFVNARPQAIKAIKKSGRTAKEAPIDPVPSLPTYILWVSLPACASLMLYAATDEISKYIAPIPLVWVLPLGLYLISFIICFDNDRRYRREFFQSAFALTIPLYFLVRRYSVEIALAVSPTFLAPHFVAMLVEICSTSVVFFLVCMLCHGELARLKPSHQRLTAFYLMVSAGGALGGFFAVVIAPLVFRDYWEYWIALWLCPVLLFIVLVKDPKSWIHQRRPVAALLLIAGSLALPELIGYSSASTILYNVVALSFLCLIATLALRKRKKPRLPTKPNILIQFSMIGSILMLGLVSLGIMVADVETSLVLTRNFYGVLRVAAEDNSDPDYRSFQLFNGLTVHGAQAPSPEWRYRPITYYGPDSGIGLLLMNYPRHSETSENSPLRIGVIGLGIGTITAWGRLGDYIRFYEINPAVIQIATDPNGYFTYLQDAFAKVEIIPGDARLSMEAEVRDGRAQQFDVLAIDAFNGDAVPVHLLTREAIQIYLRELKPDGVLAIHATNKYLDLVPVLAEQCRFFNLNCGEAADVPTNPLYMPSDWVLLARNDHVLGVPAISKHLLPIDSLKRVRLWTDDDSNLFQILRFFKD